MSIPPIAMLVLKLMKKRMLPHEYNSLMKKIQVYNYSEWIKKAPDTLREVKNKYFTKEDLFILGAQAANTGGTSMPKDDIYRWIKELADSGKDINLIDVVGSVQAATISSESIADTVNVFDSFEKFMASVETPPPPNVDDSLLESASDFLTEAFEEIGELITDIDADKISEACGQIIKWLFGVG